MGNDDKSAGEAGRNRTYWEFLFFPFGLYLFAGAFVAFRDASWPWFMPPQFDAIAILFGIFGKPVGAYVGGTCLVIFGVTCVVLSRKKKHPRRE